MRIGARWWRVRVEPDLPAELRRGSRSLGKATAKADPFVSHFLVVLLHIVELHRQLEFGCDQPADSRRDIELGERSIVLRRDKLRLRRQQLLVLNEDVECRARADQRLLLHACKGDLSGTHRRCE